MPTAFLLMRCKEGAEKAIRDMTEARHIEIQHTIGHYDLITKVTSDDSYDLDEIIEGIRRYDKVGSIKVLKANEQAMADAIS